MNSSETSTKPAGIAAARVIDVHAHIRMEGKVGPVGSYGPEHGVDENGRPWYRVGNFRLVGVRHTTSPFTDPDLRLERMAEAGIDFQVVSPSPLTYFHHVPADLALDYARRWNNALAETISQYPDRLGGLATLPMQDPVAAAEELERAVTELGLWGAATGTEFGHPLDSAALDPLYEKFVKLDVPLFLHPAPAGIDGPAGDPQLKRFDLDVVAGFAAQETLAVATMVFGGVHERHPALDVWISHGGGSIPFLASRLAQAARKRPWSTEAMRKDGAFETMLSKFWFDAHVGSEAALRLLTDLVGTTRITYGTNFAGWDQPDSNDHHGPIPPEWADNARRLLRRATGQHGRG